MDSTKKKTDVCETRTHPSKETTYEKKKKTEKYPYFPLGANRFGFFKKKDPIIPLAAYGGATS